MAKAIGFKRNRDNNTGSQGHNLTSLVDCFAIILIYLLVATSFSEFDVQIPDGMKLPKASKAQAFSESTLVEVRNNQYFVSGKSVALRDLAEVFKGLFQNRKDQSKKGSILIQADQEMNYSEINPVVLAGLSAGFDEIQFAVLKEDM